IDVSGGTSPYTYLWSNGGSGLDSVKGLSPGDISVIVTDDFGCKSSDTITIMKPNKIDAATESEDVSTCGGNDGSATASGIGGVQPYTYKWDNGATTATISSLQAGTFNVSIIDFNGCLDIDTVIVNDSAAPLLFVTDIISPSCVSSTDGSATVSVTSGTGIPPFKYTWSNGDTGITGTNLKNGFYTVSVEGSDACKSSMVVRISEPSFLTSTADTVNVSCFGGSDGKVTVTPKGATPGYTYSWSTTPSQKDSIATGLTVGTYTATIRDANNCALIKTYPITQPTLLSVSLDSIDITCNGVNDGAAIATPSGGTIITSYTYKWSNGITSFAITGLAEEMYTVTILDAKNCITIDSTFVNDPPPIISSIIDTVFVSCKNGTDGSATVTHTGGTAPYTYLWSPIGGTNAKGVNMGQGNYSATVTDFNGCKSTSNITLTEPATSLNLNITYTLNPTCGNADGSAVVSASGGIPGYNYKWVTVPAQNDSVATALVGETTFIVTVTDANSCSDTISIKLKSELRTKTFFTDVSCYGGSDGTARISAMSGTPPFTYSWNNNLGNDSLATNMPAGTDYIVQIDDVNCSAKKVIIISEPPVYAVEIVTQTNVSCKDGNDGTSRASAYGGTPGYSYSWSNIDNDSIIINLTAGSYVITAYDSKNCPALDTVVITEPDSLLLYTAQTNISCQGGSDGTTRVSGSGGTNPYAFKWTTLATDSNVSGLVIGTYTVTVTDSKSCRNTASVVLTEPLTLIGNITDSTNVSCFGGNDGIATITPSQGTPGYTYLWNTNPVQTDSTASGLVVGITTVEITDAKGCKITMAVNLQQPTQVIIDTLSVTHASCNGINDGSIRVSASEGTSPYTYKWNTNPIQSDSLAITLIANNYVVTVVDAQSCTTIRTVTVTEPLTLLFNIMDTTNVSCKNGSDGAAIVNPSGGTTPYSYLWSLGATTKSVTNLPADLYTARVTDFKGCINIDTVNITEPETLFAYVIDKKDITCFNGSDGTTAASAAGGTAPYNYIWNTGTKDSTDNLLPIGTYTITVSDNLGCVDTAKITLVEPGPIIATPKTSQDTICIGQTATIIAFGTGGNGSYTYLWNTGSTSNTIFASPIVDSTYTVTITDSLGCSVDSSILIPVYDSLKVTATSDDYLLCQGEETVIRATPAGGNGHYLFNWVADQGGLGDQQKVLINPSQTTTYFLTLSDDCGTPVATDSVKVNVLSIDFEPDQAAGCPPVKVQFKDLSNTDSTNVWFWDFGDGNTSTEQNPLHIYEFTGFYNVKLSVKTQQGCTSDKTIPNMVEVYPSPVSSFSLNPSTATTLTNFQFTDRSEGHIRLLWDFGDGVIDSINTDPQHSYDDTGHYNISLVVYNADGCTDTLVHTVYTGPEFIFYVPNAFTPNGDGINDYFYGVGVGIAEFKMSIFNKWGGIIFVTKDQKEKWKGSVDNSDNFSPNSIFIYLIEIKDYFGIDHRYIGHVTLIR
ncbi:MAG: gliding motility-associated C-terminal domain-containing protein, partial [Bacteroidia bacterium]|nr:gliding motility-associated C-terminal domain-containing protein [Bacteroidia bacterium]